MIYMLYTYLGIAFTVMVIGAMILGVNYDRDNPLIREDRKFGAQLILLSPVWFVFVVFALRKLYRIARGTD